MHRPTPPLPTFLIIGAQKSATRWLRVNLGEHPDVFTADEELSFFNHRRKWRRWGTEWYRDQFGGWDGEPVMGESTPGYMILRHDPQTIAKRIEVTLPDVRLIAVLRNPIDRANSALLHHQRRGRLPSKAKLTKVIRKRSKRIQHLGLVEGGLYFESLRPYVRRYGDRLQVLLHDDIVRNPVRVYRDALLHIGADPSFVPPALAEVRFSNRKPDAKDDGLTLEDRVALWPYFRDDVKKLQRLIHRNLGMWDPTRAARREAAAVSGASDPNASAAPSPTGP
jgi:hypothetical protein